VSPTVLGHGEDTQVAMNASPTLPWRNPGDPYPEILALPLTVAEIMELFENPLHPYTKTLLSAVPAVERKGKNYPRGNGFHSYRSSSWLSLPYPVLYEKREDMRDGSIRFTIRIMPPMIRTHTRLRCQCSSLMFILHETTLRVDRELLFC